MGHFEKIILEISCFPRKEVKTIGTSMLLHKLYAELYCLSQTKPDFFDFGLRLYKVLKAVNQAGYRKIYFLRNFIWKPKKKTKNHSSHIEVSKGWNLLPLKLSRKVVVEQKLQCYVMIYRARNFKNFVKLSKIIFRGIIFLCQKLFRQSRKTLFSFARNSHKDHSNIKMGLYSFLENHRKQK